MLQEARHLNLIKLNSCEDHLLLLIGLLKINYESNICLTTTKVNGILHVQSLVAGFNFSYFKKNW